ncbi:unnamed protein product [Fraxinus pennsylvanica]|uniref:Retrovirus-related Pol polyprotein from transposon TNT 1-94 n=1 Tax=Fraxinus pennsylvanica TaxID=56036 RepID=A0AAD2ABA8_9LAMI|nr:unnamed protein product [Fraxinus pennsylvanica]
MESEFIVLDKTSEEAEWLRNFLMDIPLWSKHLPAIYVHCDNQAAISKAQNSSCNGKSRHIRRRHNIVRQLLKDGVIAIHYLNSSDNIANPLTKELAKELVQKTSREMGLKSITN